LVGVPVIAQRVDDNSGAFVSRRRYTDDRGIYRIYGLLAGRYVVYGGDRGSGYAMMSEKLTRTYHPSAPSEETAARVEVAAASESTGVDIQFGQSPIGYAITGAVSGIEAGNDRVSVSIKDAVTKTSIGASNVTVRDAGHVFAFYDISDGQYELTANQYDENGRPRAAAQPLRVVVRGVNVTGLTMKLLPLATIAGRVTIEGSLNTCDPNSKYSLQEFLVSA
jgi:hypothetical protein